MMLIGTAEFWNHVVNAEIALCFLVLVFQGLSWGRPRRRGGR